MTLMIYKPLSVRSYVRLKQKWTFGTFGPPTEEDPNREVPDETSTLLQTVC